MDRISQVKQAILELISKQKYVYEDDYHDLCYDLSSKEASAINDWIIQSYIPIKKNDVGRKYKKRVKTIIQNPSLSNVKKIKTLPPKTHRASIQDVIADIDKLEILAGPFEEETQMLESEIHAYAGTGNLNWAKIKSLFNNAVRTYNRELIRGLMRVLRGDEDEAKKLGLLFSTRVSFKDVEFLACVAENAVDKAKGLEAFASLDAENGLLFPFNKEHVTFHMGSVSYPIDIIFLTPTVLGLKVAKIVNNAQPGTADRWSCNEVSHVLEVVGGSCEKYNIKPGDLCILK